MAQTNEDLWLSEALQGGSTILGTAGQIAKGNAAVQVAKGRQIESQYEAGQLDTEAGMSRGVGMRNAADIARNVELINSAALARAAASGAGASDPTVMNVLAKTAGEGAYRQTLAMYEGEAQARLDTMRASALRYEGDLSMTEAQTAEKATDIGAASTLLTGGANMLSMYSKYWSGPGG